MFTSNVPAYKFSLLSVINRQRQGPSRGLTMNVQCWTLWLSVWADTFRYGHLFVPCLSEHTQFTCQVSIIQHRQFATEKEGLLIFQRTMKINQKRDYGTIKISSKSFRFIAFFLISNWLVNWWGALFFFNPFYSICNWWKYVYSGVKNEFGGAGLAKHVIYI